MRFAEEVVAATFVPTWRSLLARALHERGLSQTEIARLVGVTQSAVSKHLLGKLKGDPRLEDDVRMRETTARVAAGLAEGTISAFEALHAAEQLVRVFEDRGPICRIHEEEMPALAGLGCDICVRGSFTALLPEQAALNDLRAALRVIEQMHGLATFLPHVGANVARATPGATTFTQVAAVPGRLFEAHGMIKVPAPPEFGVSRHVSEVLLSILRSDASRLACMNLAPHPRLLDAARAAGLHVLEVSADVERTPAALTFPGRTPDIFFHAGAFGIEPQAYLSATDALRLVSSVGRLLDSSRP